MHKPAAATALNTATRFANHGVYEGVANSWLRPQKEHDYPVSFDKPHYYQERLQAFAEFGFPQNITYDDFNRQTGGLTRKEYLHYIYNTYPKM
ncbi:hypothetical protein MHB44_10550 [Lysinibacillus sp. FSL H8-0500]|uniref:hypothetical protein n=1 Tax=Lysinibacillus sp. FSL H8-0500 TaxID=2921393 RepID=UPI003100CEF5